MKLNKKTLAALAVTALLSGTAMAETSFTIYGRANVSVEQQKVGSQSDSVMVDNASRLGFRANRDLSDGMSVGTVLEAGTNLTSGSTKNKLFAREASVALNGAFGQVKLGRMPASVAYFATADYVSNHNHDTGTSSDALYDFLATGSLSNAVGYASPKLGALKLEAQYGLKKSTGAGTNDSAVVNPVAAAASYDAGALQLGLGYESAQNPVLAASNPTTTSTASQVTARAFYTMGPLGFGGYVQKSSGTNFARNAYRLSAMYTLGQNEFHVNVGAAGNRAGAANTGASQYTLGYNYNLDKQTKVYALYTKINQDSATNAYQANSSGFVSGSTANGLSLNSVGAGVRYNF